MNIGIFGRPNAGKSSLLNFLTGTQTAIVSDVPGTTTDPVSKRMEVPGVGICNFIDTAGLADGSSLSLLKDRKTVSRIQSLDAALLMIPYNSFILPSDSEICTQFKQNGIPFLVLLSKEDLFDEKKDIGPSVIGGSGKFTQSIELLNNPLNENIGVMQITECSVKDSACKERIFEFLAQVKNGSREYEEKPMFEGLVSAGDKVVLVCPVDSEAPAGRLILPQVMAIRQLLDLGAIVTVLQPEQLGAFMDDHSACVQGSVEAASESNICDSRKDRSDGHVPFTSATDSADTSRHGISLVVTDSQAFAKVAPLVPANVPLTSFSMLLARAKGPFEDYLAGMRFLESLGARTRDCADSHNCSSFIPRQEDLCGTKKQCELFCGIFRVLMLESCTHHSTCEDIGRVKIPAALTKYIKAHCAGVSDVQFTFVSSDNEIPSDVPFNLAVQCGGCVVTKRQLMSRLSILHHRGIPLVNYGMCLALCAGIWKRVGAIFQ